MSADNVANVHQAVEAANRRDLDALLALFHPDVEILSRLVPLEGGYRGHDGVRRYWKNLLDTFPDLTVELVQVKDLGDVTVTETRVRAHGADSETPVEMTMWSVAEYRDGRTVWWTPRYDSEAEAREAARQRLEPA